MSDLDFWGGEQIIPSAPFEPSPASDEQRQQPARFNEPGQVNPAEVPLPEDPVEHENAAPQNRPGFQEESVGNYSGSVESLSENMGAEISLEDIKIYP